MCNRDNLESNINHIYDNLELLEAGNIYELRKTPGKPKCATLAKQIREDVEAIAEGLEECIEDADEEQFELLAKLLGALYSEFSALSKKQPDALTNTFKTKQINRVLVPLKQIMNSEDSVQYLDLLSETDEVQITGRGSSSYSVAVIIMSQYKTACDEFRRKYFNKLCDHLW